MIEIRDPIHGFVKVSDAEAAIIAHPVFQRLRRIHQLAMAYLVYPGATHTRFSHAIGTLHVAAKLADAAGLDDDDVQNVRLSALLHDIGHGPFSHVSEDVLAQRNPDTGRNRGEEEIHEAISIQVIKNVFLRENLITDPQFAAVKELLTGRLSDQTDGSAKPVPYRTVARDIVSGPLDADKMDYLLRDTYHCGVQYGVYDIDRLTRAVRTLLDPDSTQSYLAVVEEDVPTVDQFIIAKHHMTIQVYRHKVRRIADAMLARSVLLSLADGNCALQALYSVDLDNEDYVRNYLEYDDERLIRAVLEGPEGPGKELMRDWCKSLR